MFFSSSQSKKEPSPLLLEIKRYIETVAAGDFNQKITTDLKDQSPELAVVVSSLNAMSERLKELFAFMDLNIKEKSTELSNKVDELNKSNRAILNLLEDIEAEKARAENMVVVRTRELSDERARLIASINSLSWGFMIADINDIVILKNPAILKILEITTEVKTTHDVSRVFDTINLLALTKQCIDGKKIVDIREILFKKKYLRLSFSPIFDSTHIIGYAIIIEDITEAKVMERSRDEFFAVASHELRTPLTAIRGNAEMILDMYGEKITDKDVKEMLVDINSSSVRLIEIVNDFLEVSRLEQGKVEMKFESVDPSDVITKVVRDLQSSTTKKGVVLSYNQGIGKAPMVRVDKNRLEQVLLNLVGNSVKFTSTGSITVSTEQIDKFLKISVTDTGLGISEQNQSRLFRKFQQAGEQMLARDVTQGTGLGLYISQLLVSGMGGAIGIEKSELGKGSTFAFTVPISA